VLVTNLAVVNCGAHTDDPSNDVQSVAVKCLAIITKKVQQAQISDVCKKLCSLVLDGKDALRDVYSIGLKTLIADVPESMGTMVADQLTAKLLVGISRQDAEDIQRECLDNMTDLLRRFGQLNAGSHPEIMKQVVKQLQSERAVIRKRAAHCLGALVVVSSDALLNSLMQILLDGIEAAAKTSSGATSQSTRTLIQTIGTISRTVGHRLSKHLDRIVPLFLRFCGDPNDESQQTDAANELRESCFPGTALVRGLCASTTSQETDVLSLALQVWSRSCCAAPGRWRPSCVTS
jgi:hypothetical protein